MLTRTDRRSLACHRAVVEKLLADPERCLAKARTNLAFMAGLHPYAHRIFERRSRWLDLSPEDLASQVLDPGEVDCDVRQVSPFAGLLSAAERARILRRFREAESA